MMHLLAAIMEQFLMHATVGLPQFFYLHLLSGNSNPDREKSKIKNHHRFNG
jgi:hypothetical protein